MLSKGSDSVQTQPETGAVAPAQEASSSISSRWRWVLYATAGVALVLALKYFHVQDLLKAALDWIGKLGPWGPVIFVGLYVVATVLFVPGSVLTLGAGAVFGVALGSVCVHERDTGRHGRISGGPLPGARCHRAEDREARAVRGH
jgi:hypothetical protein